MSPSDPEYLDGEHDHTECVGQEIVGEKNVRSHVLNGLLGRADQTDFFTDYTLTEQSGAHSFWKSAASRRPQAGLAVQGIVRMVLAMFISPIALCRGIKSLLATDTGSRQPLPVAPGSSLANFFSAITIDWTQQQVRRGPPAANVTAQRELCDPVHDSLSHALPDAVSLRRN